MRKNNALFFVCVLSFCMSCTNITQNIEGSNSQELLKVYSLWKNKGSKDDVLKSFGKESKSTMRDGNEQIYYEQSETYLPKLVFELSKENGKITSVFYSPQMLDIHQMKNALPCGNWDEKTARKEKKDLIYSETVLTCKTEVIQAKQQSQGPIEEIWFGGGE